MNPSRYPDSLSAPALPGAVTGTLAENPVLRLQGQKEVLFEHVSRLYNLFFGTPRKEHEDPTDSAAPTEPDYYSSYE